MDDERRKKIEAGKLKFAKFKKRKFKGETVKNDANAELPVTSESCGQVQENSESVESSSFESLNTKEECKTPSYTEMEPNLIAESSFQFSEGSDDALQLENANSQLVSLYNQKIESYQSTIRHREGIIQQLTERLASAMSANEAADSAGSMEVRNLKQEISILHQQMRDATEMIEKQKLEYRENVLNACGDGKHILPIHKVLTNEVSIQVESVGIPQYSQTLKFEESLDDMFTEYSKVPEFTQKIINFLIKNTTPVELEGLLNVLSLTGTSGRKNLSDDMESIDEVLLKCLKFPDFSQKLGDFLKNNTTELELKNIANKLLGLDSTAESPANDLSKPNIEVSLKKMETLGVITKMIESLVNASTRTLDDSACSKFQSFFLQRLNSKEDEPDALENEGDINYAEVTGPNQEKLFGKNSCEISSIEKLRGGVSADDFSLVTDFLLEEVDKLSASVIPLDTGSRGDVMVDSLETELPAVSLVDGIDSDFRKFLQQMAELESKLNNLKEMDINLQDLGKRIQHTSIDSDILTNSEDNILLEEPALSCVSLLSLTDSECKTEYAMTDSELNSRKVSFDMARPVQDNSCVKCEKYYELVREKYHDHVCIFKDALEKSLSIEKAETVKNLEFEIEKIKLEKDKLMNENSEQIELLCQEQELKIQHLKQENEKYLQELKSEWKSERDRLTSIIAQFEETSVAWDQQIVDILESKNLLFQELQILKSSNAEDDEQERITIEAHLESLQNIKDKHMVLTNECQQISKEKALLVEELEALKLRNAELVEEEKRRIDAQYISTLEVLKKIHEDEIVDLKNSFKKQFDDQDSSFEDKHSKAISLLEKQVEEKELLLGEQQSKAVNLEKHLEEKESLLREQHSKAVNLEKQLEEKELLLKEQYCKAVNLEKQLEEKELLLREQYCKALSLEKQLEEKELSLRDQHSKAISVLEASHLTESATLQKKIEQLLEEKCELLSKTTQEYESILKKNHKALVSLCNHLRSQLNVQKEKILNESHKSVHSELEMSFSDAFDELNKSIEDGILRFLNQNYFLSDDHEENFDETEYLSLQVSHPLTENYLPLKKDNEQLDNFQEFRESEPERGMSRSLTQLSEGESDDFYMIRSEMNKLQEEFQKDVQMYQDKITELHEVIKTLKKQALEHEEHKKKLEAQLQEKESDLATKESELAAITSGSKNSMSGSQLSSNEIRSWQVDAARNNSRLLHVLSDLVQTFLDIERDINSHLIEHGLIPSRSGPFTQQDEETGHSVGSREDFASLSIGECPNLELVEDGPDLTPRTWDLFVAVGTYDTEIEGEDVVLGASRRLRLAVDHLLNLLTRALNNQQNQDLKLLLKRNEELSQELQEESLGRDAVHMELVTAESTIRKLEGEKQRLEDLNRDLKENQELLKREVRSEKNRVAQLSHEKEVAEDKIQMLQGQCELLASRLGDPEKKLLQENSKLSSEKHTVQKSLSKERQSFLDRLHHMEVALEELNAEKEAVVEQKCKEIQDLRAEMEAMEKQLNSNRKFIDEQAQEREQEREEYIREMNRMQDMVREKEKIQSNEAQLTKDIESLEQLLRARIEDHQSVVKKKEGVENELRQSVDKIRDLHEVIEELETQLDKKCKLEVELRQKLSGLNESISTQEKIHFALGEESVKPRNGHINGESLEQMENLKEQLASQSQEIEQMSQSQTLLHELRGQIHFLEAKVEQRARLLESMHLASSPIPSDDNSPGSQGSEQLQLQDGYEMSPRSIHWLEVRRLEEKIGRIIHVDEEISRKNKELEGQMRRMKSQQNELQHENAALQERLSEQLLQISILKSHIEEEKHRCNTPQKSQAVNDKIEELHEAFEKQLENNKKLVSEMQEMHGDLDMLKEEIQKRDNLIAILQKSLDVLKKEKLIDTEQSDKHSSAAPFDSNEKPACYKLMLLEKNEEVIIKNQEIERLQNELEKLREVSEDSSLHNKELERNVKIADEFAKENVQLKSKVEQLNKEVAHLKECLSSAKEQVEMEQAQVETLCEEMANLSQNSIEEVPSPKSDRSTNSLERENTYLARRLHIRETQLKEKVAEISALNANIMRLELLLRASEKEVKLEQVQVETLMQELGSLTGYQKRLEQDFNTIQEMMQQKERELATLHEETDAQMRLEGELETLEKELEEHQAKEEELQQVIQQMQMDSEGSMKDLHLQIEQWRAKCEDMQKNHSEEVRDLRRQIEILCRQLERGDTEDIDIADVRREIMEASISFGADDNETYGNLVYSLVKKAVDSKLGQMAKNHEAHIKKINETWEQKIKSELSHKRQFKNHCEKLEKENLLLRETFDERNQRLSSEKDAHWDAKLNSIENTIKHELKTKYEEETNHLKHSLEKISSEKSAAEAKLLDLGRQVKDLKKSQTTKNEMLKELENKIATMEKQLMEKQQAEMMNRQTIERLREDLESQLKREKALEDRHKEEMSNLNELFEKRWFTEMKKIQVMQVEELKKLKDSKEKTVEALCSHLFAKYEEKLKGLQDEYALKIEEEKGREVQRHKEELKELQLVLERRFEKEKKQILEMKDKEFRRNMEGLEKRYNKKISELRRSGSSSERKSSSDGTSRLEEEKLRLSAAHKREMSELKRQLETKYEEKLQSQLRAHEMQRKRLEEAYALQVEKVNELMRESRRAASVNCHSDSGSNRTTTPSSEMTSSDETSGSCLEDMMPGNQHLLVKKITQGGKRILSLVESSQVPTSAEREARLWLEERTWIIHKITSLTPEIVENQANLKLVISNLVEELLNARQKLIFSNDEINSTRERCSNLEDQLNGERSKISILVANLSNHSQLVKEFQTRLDSKSNEVMELKKVLANENRLHHLKSAEKDSPRLHSGNLSSSYDIERLRSADERRSAERFSMFLPEIDSMSLPKTVEEIEISQDVISPPQFLKDSDLPDAPVFADSVSYGSKNDVSSIREELMEKLSDTRHSTSYAKLHGLYWVYKRSLSYNKSLVYQKNYLLTLLKGFQVTEMATLAWLNHLNNDSPKHNTTRLKGRRLFRSAGFVVVALARMRYFVRRWRLLARIPSAHTVEAEVRGVFASHLSPTLTPGDCHLSSLSLSSKSTSIGRGEPMTNSQTLINSRSDSKTSVKMVNTDTSLLDCVHRLKILQKHLGLDQNFR